MFPGLPGRHFLDPKLTSAVFSLFSLRPPCASGVRWALWQGAGMDQGFGGRGRGGSPGGFRGGRGGFRGAPRGGRGREAEGDDFPNKRPRMF